MSQNIENIFNYSTAKNVSIENSEEAIISLPIINESVISETRDSEGSVEGMSLLLKDSKNKFFTLYISTMRNHIKYLNEINDNLAIADLDENNNETEEPVLVLPVDELDEERVLKFVNSFNIDYLKLFVVRQTDDVQSEL